MTSGAMTVPKIRRRGRRLQIGPSQRADGCPDSASNPGFRRSPRGRRRVQGPSSPVARYHESDRIRRYRHTIPNASPSQNPPGAALPASVLPQPRAIPFASRWLSFRSAGRRKRVRSNFLPGRKYRHSPRSAGLLIISRSLSNAARSMFVLSALGQMVFERIMSSTVSRFVGQLLDLVDAKESAARP